MLQSALDDDDNDDTDDTDDTDDDDEPIASRLYPLLLLWIFARRVRTWVGSRCWRVV